MVEKLKLFFVTWAIFTAVLFGVSIVLGGLIYGAIVVYRIYPAGLGFYAITIVAALLTVAFLDDRGWERPLW